MAGRPPIHFTDEELHVLGEEMLLWMKEHKLDPLFVHLSNWYSEIKEIPRSSWHAIRQRNVFLQYYERAMEFMESKTMINEKLSTAYGSRYLGLYSKDLREHERELKFEVIDHEAQVKSDAANKNQTSPNDCLLSDLIKAVKESK